MRVESGHHSSGKKAGRSEGGSSSRVRSFQRVDLGDDDLDSLEKEKGTTAVTDVPPARREKFSGKGSAKAGLSKGKGGALETGITYVNPDTGETQYMMRYDCNFFQSAPIASCLLDSIVLDGDWRNLDAMGDLAANVRAMDLGYCLVLSRYQKLKELVVITEAKKGEREKMKEKLENVHTVQVLLQANFDELKKQHDQVALEKMVMAGALEEANDEVALYTGYVEKATAAAKAAKDAYETLFGEEIELAKDYNDMEQKYLALQEGGTRTWDSRYNNVRRTWRC